MSTPLLTRPRRSVGVLVYPFVAGLVFAGAAALAHWAGTTWSPKPAWDQPPPVPPTAPAPSIDACDRETPSGLRFAVLVRGDGVVSPRPHDTVEVRFEAWDALGVELAGIPNDRRTQFRVDQLIPGWVEGLQLMSVGDVYRLCIPEALAYKGRPGAPAGILTFDVALLAIK